MKDGSEPLLLRHTPQQAENSIFSDIHALDGHGRPGAPLHRAMDLS
jgi:hypothetical protein